MLNNFMKSQPILGTLYGDIIGSWYEFAPLKIGITNFFTPKVNSLTIQYALSRLPMH